MGKLFNSRSLAIAALERAASWVGTISPADVTDAQEEDARLIWPAGNAAFMRNWPYAYPLSIGEDSNVVDKFVRSVLIGEQEAEAALKQLELDLEELLSFSTEVPVVIGR